MIEPRTPPGVLELLPVEQAAFRRMLEAIRSTYESFGFVEIETPVFERSDVLLTKTGGETERQIYFVQSTGALERGETPDLALRFDLTVPLARYVAEHQHELTFPFKRYQIQRVYRGERPQRGRFREFYQCDIDVIGRENLSVRHDAEIPAVIQEVFRRLDIGPFTILVNHRMLMRGLLEAAGVASEETQAAAMREIDKLDKRGRADVARDLSELGLSDGAVTTLLETAATRVHGPDAALRRLAAIEPSNESIGKAVSDLTVVFETMRTLRMPPDAVALDLGIARGLEYYTGTVYETVLDDHPEIGSICSGGRYDDLAGLYTTTRLPGVGISIGLTRLFWQLREAGLLAVASTSVEAYVTIMDDEGRDYGLRVASALRAAGVNTDLATEPDRLGTQLKYAARVGARVALIAGEDERSRGTVAVKDLAGAGQTEVPFDDLVGEVERLLTGAG